MKPRSLAIAVSIAFVAGLGGLFAYDTLVLGRELRARREMVQEKQLEVARLGAIVNEVERYQKDKDELQKRFEVINTVAAAQSSWYPELALAARVTALPGVTVQEAVLSNGATLTFGSPPPRAAVSEVQSWRFEWPMRWEKEPRRKRPVIHAQLPLQWTLRLEPEP